MGIYWATKCPSEEELADNWLEVDAEYKCWNGKEKMLFNGLFYCENYEMI